MKTYVEFKLDPEKGGEPIPGALPHQVVRVLLRA